MTWMKTMQNDLDSHGLSWTDAVDMAQNRPLWWLLKIASVVPFAGINPNCIASIFTFSLIVRSKTRSITFIAYSSNFIAL